MADINIALNKPATASNSVAPYTPDKAVDGKASSSTPFSRWLCNSVPGWICINLGVPVFTKRWVVKHLPLIGWTAPNFANSDYKLQGSNDNVNWTDIDSIVGNTASTTDRTFNPMSFQYYRVYFTKGLNTNTKMASIVEFELYQYFSSFLSALTVSSGTLSPTFNKTTLSYTDTVPYSVNSITVTPTAENAQAIIKVNNVLVPSGSASQAIPLNIGANTISISVSAYDGTITTYTITVNRADSAYLSSLTAQSGNPITLIPAFSKTEFNYTASVGYDVTGMTVTPTSENPNATIKVNNSVVVSGQASQNIPLSVGSNTITILVTTPGGLQQTYTINVTKADSAYLNTLVIKSGVATYTLNPGFAPQTFNYTSSAGSKNNATVTPTAQSATAVVKVNGTQITTSQPSVTVPINNGTNTITIEVTNGGFTNSYIVTITKP
ncbi:MAG TPA: cadherin-like beta sandwich domain-containing protein [Bacteroidales bacterium]|nr:cadherin-like beta sandwich domain-containing protein [Bacteroidales bacterium]HPS16683.1 cadherin-like beta sandwich domain-containing protein [Bacteroidales bacterium]